MKRQIILRDLDILALNYLSTGGAFQTWHVARAIGLDREAGDAATTRTRTILKRLEHHGLVRGPRSGSVLWWQITDAGRAGAEGAAA